MTASVGQRGVDAGQVGAGDGIDEYRAGAAAAELDQEGPVPVAEARGAFGVDGDRAVPLAKPRVASASASAVPTSGGMPSRGSSSGTAATPGSGLFVGALSFRVGPAGFRPAGFRPAGFRPASWGVSLWLCWAGAGPVIAAAGRGGRSALTLPAAEGRTRRTARRTRPRCARPDPLARRWPLPATRKPSARTRWPPAAFLDAEPLGHHPGDGTAGLPVAVRPGVQRLGQPAPAHLPDQRVGSDLRLELGTDVGDDPQRSRPSGLACGIIQQDEPAPPDLGVRIGRLPHGSCTVTPIAAAYGASLRGGGYSSKAISTARLPLLSIPASRSLPPSGTWPRRHLGSFQGPGCQAS